MKKTEWHEIAQCRADKGKILLDALQEKFRTNLSYQFRFNVPCLQVLGIRTEHEFYYFDSFCSGFLLGLDKQTIERKED